MTFDNLYAETLSPPTRFKKAGEKLSQIQTELVSEVLRRAVNDASSAMAHQLSQPLTALLLYLHEIKQAGDRSDGDGSASESLCEIVDMALRETERVCDILEQVGKAGDKPVDAEAAVARGCEAIGMWTWDRHVNTGSDSSAVQPRAKSYPLTPREHEVLTLITDGYSNKEGGYRLGISTRTFEAHRAHLMGKLGAKNVADLIRRTSSRDR